MSGGHDAPEHDDSDADHARDADDSSGDVAPVAASLSERPAWLSFLRALLGTGMLVTLCALTLRGGVSVPSVTFTMLLLPLLPLPLALAGLRHGQSMPLLAAPVLALVTFALVWEEIASLGTAVLAAALATWAGAGMAWVLLESAQNRRFSRMPVLAVTLALLVVAAIPTGTTLVLEGDRRIKSMLTEHRDNVTANLRQACQEERLDCDSDNSRRLARELSLAGEAVVDYPRMFTITTLAGAAFLIGFVMLRLFTWLASRAQLPVGPQRLLRDFEVGWPIAYVLAAGLALLTIRWNGITDSDPLALLGAALVVLGLLPITVQGLAVVLFLLNRWRVRTWVKVVFWLLMLMASNFLLVFFTVVGLVELAMQLRRRSTARIDPSDQA